MIVVRNQNDAAIAVAARPRGGFGRISQRVVRGAAEIDAAAAEFRGNVERFEQFRVGDDTVHAGNEQAIAFALFEQAHARGEAFERTARQRDDRFVATVVGRQLFFEQLVRGRAVSRNRGHMSFDAGDFALQRLNPRLKLIL